MSVWPNDRRAAVSVTFDNLGEAAEIQLGLRGADDELDGHYSVEVGLPIVLDELESTELEATFFVEGINGEAYPDALRTIAAAGHELAFHAHCHEEWGSLTPAEEAANLDRGLAALRDGAGLEVRGFRPPGGQIGPTTPALLAERGLSYCSPAAGVTSSGDGIVMLPFDWTAVDVFHVLPQFEEPRARLTGAAEPGGPEAAKSAMLTAIDAAIETGGHAVLVFHTWIAEHERPQLHEILSRIADHVASGDLWAARCDAVATWFGARR